MPTETKVFLDTSALFSGIWSPEGGARLILKLAEARQINLLVSSHVLAELESTVQKKAPEKLGQLVLLLHEIGTQVVGLPSPQTVQETVALTGYIADAHVLAAAIDAEVDYFVTLDKQHFLDNEQLKGAVPFPVGTPGDFLAWFRIRLVE